LFEHTIRKVMLANVHNIE